MEEKCSKCEQDFMPEPGFYYGAMFLSYILTAFIFLGVGLTAVFYFGYSAEMAMVFIILIAAFLHNYFFKLSRSIWIHLIVPYDSKTD